MIATTIYMFLFGMRGAQLLLVMLVVLLLFGTAKIPQIMRNLGKGVHSFRQGLEDAKAEAGKEIIKADSGEAGRAEDKDA